jgi:hypothetical protein
MTLQSVVQLPPPLNGMDLLQRPPINDAVVALIADDLQCQVLVRAHERHGLRVRRLHVELHHRWAVSEPCITLGRLLAAVRQDVRDEGRLGAGGRRPSWSRRKKAVSRRGVARAHRPCCHVKETTSALDDATAVAGDLPTTNKRENEREWLRMGRRVWSGTRTGEIRMNQQKHLGRRQTHDPYVLFRGS